MITADRNLPTDLAPVTVGWLRRAAVLAQASRAPDPGYGAYTWLVWQWQMQERGLLTAQHQYVLNALPTAVQVLRDQPWVQRYLELAEDAAAGNPLTGSWRTQWLARQRRLYANGELAAGRAALLDRLTGFSWNPIDGQWESTFTEVERFAAEHRRIPTRGDDIRLSNWLAGQRFLLRSDRLRFDRAQALSALPGWKSAMSSTRSRGPWERRCEQLRGFLEEHGRYPSSASADPAEVAVAQWVTAQREQLRRDGLSQYRIDALSALPGWRWGARDADWDARLREVSRDVRRRRGISTDHRLYGWVVAQRRRHRDGRLTDEQADALRSLNLLDERVVRAA